METIKTGDVVTIKPHPAASRPTDGKPWEVLSSKDGALFLRLVGGTSHDTCGASTAAVESVYRLAPFALTRTTSELVAGDRIRIQETDSRNYCIPFSEAHPGTVETVVSVEPWMLTGGNHAGEQARAGRGKNSPLLFTVKTDAGSLNAATLDRVWTLANDEIKTEKGL